jgi:hypothetical protein
MKTDRIQGILFNNDKATRQAAVTTQLLERTAALAGRLKHLITRTNASPDSRHKLDQLDVVELHDRLRRRQ